MLEKIFTSKTRIKILDYLFFCKKETYLREISKTLKISPSSVKREIDNLCKIGLVQKQQNKIKINEQNPIINDLKNIFIKTDSIIHPIKKALQKIDAKYILIFGSFAEGTYTPESDIDLLIIGNCKQSRVFSCLKTAEQKIGREINPIVWTLKNIIQNKKTGFVKDISKKKKIMIKGNKNEFQKIIRQ